MSAQITPDQVEYKKRIGKMEGQPVFEVGLIGGLCMVVDRRGQPLGAGPHRAVARHIAKKRNPTLEWTELSKADHVEEEHYAHLLPQYEELTDQLSAAAQE